MINVISIEKPDAASFERIMTGFYDDARESCLIYAKSYNYCKMHYRKIMLNLDEMMFMTLTENSR